MSGKMSSRQLLVYLDGLVADERSRHGWYAQTVLRDWEELKQKAEEQHERECRAVNEAAILHKPLRMDAIVAPEDR